MSIRILTAAITHEEDVVQVRQRAKQIAALLGFEVGEQTRIATAASEIARNAFSYGGGGQAEFILEGKTPPQVFLLQISDRGQGIKELDSILEGRYRSSTGMGLGMVGARRLMDQFKVETGPQGTVVQMRKLLPTRAPRLGPSEVAEIASQIQRRPPRDPMTEVREQNRELLDALMELRKRQEELTRINRELEDTNRGVVALYAELDERADHLRRADELKSKFLSNMSHEFRTPLNSILGLCRLLLDRSDGELSLEQEKQVNFIKKAAEELSQLVNDLLDLAKVEAGKVVVHSIEFQVASLFGALRGMLRPLLLNESVNLVFEEPLGIPALHTDEGKVSQILRNFISNALKFTERGEVRISASLAAGENRQDVVFAVADTGIGIAPENHELIFQEFTQVENPLQRRVKGTGLGLPLCKKLVGLLGGSVSVESQLGVGSTFYARIPLVYCPPATQSALVKGEWEPDPSRTPVLVVEDSPEALLLYEKYLNGSGFQLLPARNLEEAERAFKAHRPAAVVLDILLQGEDGWPFLVRLKEDPANRKIPVMVVTNVEDQHKGIALGADAYCVKPPDRDWLLDKLRSLTGKDPTPRILIIDDDQVARYLMKQILSGPDRRILEAASGAEGLERAREAGPRAIFLDLVMPGMDGFEVLERLKADPRTRETPVVIVTSLSLAAREREVLEAKAAAVLSKDSVASDAGLAVVHQVLSGVGLRQVS
jgi:signal transduction histidine kinase/CheY-like chemotaxis protein